MGHFKFDGLDDLEKHLKKMQRAAEELDGTHEVPLAELFTSSFMRKYTNFASFDSLLASGGFHAETSEEFEAIPEELLDKHISATTRFKSWKEMLGKASELYVSKKLGF